VVDKENYLLELSRYIHLNPVRARMVKTPEEYLWSSYREYAGIADNSVADEEDILSYFGPSGKRARREYILRVL